MATIKIRRSTTAGAVPSSLVTGEIAINEADGNLYYRTSSGGVSLLTPAAGQVITFSSQNTAQMAWKTVLVNASSATTINLDPSLVPIGTRIQFVRTGSANVTISVLFGKFFAQTTNVLSNKYAYGTATKVAATEWHFAAGAQATPVEIDQDHVKGFAEMLLARTAATPTSGGALNINGNALGNYDYVVKTSAQTVSTFTNSDWFTTTEDTASAWVLVKGNLTINSGVVFRPTNRKLFTVVYVDGDLTLNGTISMSLRGANHSGISPSGGSTTAAPILIARGTFGGTTDPTIPAAGGTGGSTLGGTNGGSATLGTGGGGRGGASGISAGVGSAGTSFSGGAGGGGYGGSPIQFAGNGGTNGGAGGVSGQAGGGGIGNPSGSTGAAHDEGTGGVLIVIVNGAVSGSGTLEANGGSTSPSGVAVTGGASGGGVAILMRKSGSGPTLSAAGGTATGGTNNGGSGGAGATATFTLP